MRHGSKGNQLKHLLLAVSLAAASCLAACAGGADTPTGCHGSASGGSGTALGNVAGGSTPGAGLGGVAGGGC